MMDIKSLIREMKEDALARQRAINLKERQKRLEEGKCRICTKFRGINIDVNGKHFRSEHLRSIKNQNCPLCSEVILPWQWSYHFMNKHLFTCQFCLKENPRDTHYNCKSAIYSKKSKAYQNEQIIFFKLQSG